MRNALFSYENRATFKSCLESHWECLSKLLLNDDVQVSMVILKLLNYVTVPRNLSSGAALGVCGSLVALFFNVLNTEGKAFISRF
jgi:hypothetical protein